MNKKLFAFIALISLPACSSESRYREQINSELRNYANVRWPGEPIQFSCVYVSDTFGNALAMNPEGSICDIVFANYTSVRVHCNLNGCLQ